MKNQIYLLIISAVLLLSCKKDVRMPFSGTITGIDFRACACCGGWFIEIDKETYRFYELPEFTNLDIESEQFPLSVDLDYIKSNPTCLGDEIDIIDIQKR